MKSIFKNNGVQKSFGTVPLIFIILYASLTARDSPVYCTYMCVVYNILTSLRHFPQLNGLRLPGLLCVRGAVADSGLQPVTYLYKNSESLYTGPLIFPRIISALMNCKNIRFWLLITKQISFSCDKIANSQYFKKMR